MNAGPEQFTATKYFTSDSIVERLNALASSLRWYLEKDSLPYLVYTTQDDKRQAFKDYILSQDHSDFAIDTILDIITEAEFLQKQRDIEYAIHRQDELLKSYVHGGSQLDNDPSDEAAAEVYEEMLREAQSCVQAGSELHNDSTDEESYW